MAVLENEIDLKSLLVLQDKEDVFRERFKMNHFCVLTFVDNEAVSYLWGQLGSVHVEKRYGFEVPIAENQVFYYDSYTRPDWRKKGLARLLVNEMAFYCKGRFNKSELITIIEISNMVSRRAYEKIGFLKDRLEFFINLMGKPVHFKWFSLDAPVK
jgi:GNAT superfamily N-acetyltransferase